MAWAGAADGRARSGGSVVVDSVYDTPVSKPRLIVPTNLEMVIVGRDIMIEVTERLSKGFLGL